MGKAFPGAEADSGSNATATLLNEVPSSHTQTRDLLQQSNDLPRSMGGFFNDRGLTLPDVDRTVQLHPASSKLTKGHDAAPGFREYDGGEPDTRTVLQQLPGKGLRVYKVIEQRRPSSDEPTSLRLRFELGCVGGGIFSTEEKKCSAQQCIGGGLFSSKPKHCTQAWHLDDRYTYLGSKGITLINPNVPSDVIPDGQPVGFLTEPVARDANRRPVAVEWRLTGRALDIRVWDGAAGVAHPVVVDPQWFVGRWLRKGALVLDQPDVQLALSAIGCGLAAALDWTETVGQVWYRRVWHAALQCLEAL